MIINALESTAFEKKLSNCLVELVSSYRTSHPTITAQCDRFLAQKKFMFLNKNFNMDPDDRAALEIRFNAVLNMIQKSGSMSACHEF